MGLVAPKLELGTMYRGLFEHLGPMLALHFAGCIIQKA